MCFVVIAIPDDMAEGEPILVDKYPTKEQAEEVKADIKLETKAYHDKIEEYCNQTVPQTASNLNITNAQQYKQYYEGLMRKRNELIVAMAVPKFIAHEIYIF